MANKAKYFCQLSALETPERAGEMQAWSVKAGIPLTNLLRDALEHSWTSVRESLEHEHGKLSESERAAGIIRAVPPARRAEYAERYGATAGAVAGAK